MGRFFALVLVGWLGCAPLASAADERDPLARARVLYNQRNYEEAIAAADQARSTPARADSADLIAARAYLERYRESSAPDDLTNARERLRRLDPHRFATVERLEFMIGLAEALYFDGSFGAAADLFDSVLVQADTVMGQDERERVIDWWASALDRDARQRPEIERQVVYQRIRDRMQAELGSTITSSPAVYWLSVAARGQGDLQGAWEAVQAGWVRAGLASDRGAALKADLEKLVLIALVPERARALGQPPEMLRQEWEQFKERWARP